MRVLSLAGPKGSGKNTLATLIREALDRRGVTAHDEVAFADPMRWACDAMGIPADVTRERKTEVSGYVGEATGRDVLVMLGEGMRSLAPNFWADHMGHRLNAITHDEPDAIVIVTDTRRDNEVAVLEAWASVDAGRHLAKLWVERPGHEADEVLEASVRARCIVLANAGSLADLRAKAEGIADWLEGGGDSIVDPHPSHLLTPDEPRCVMCGDLRGEPRIVKPCENPDTGVAYWRGVEVVS